MRQFVVVVRAVQAVRPYVCPRVHLRFIRDKHLVRDRICNRGQVYYCVVCLHAENPIDVAPVPFRVRFYLLMRDRLRAELFEIKRNKSN